jgi:uncharacterized glyoxalase superfamily protein PhnB
MSQPSVTPYPTYLDPKAAMAFLEAAFGFELHVMVLGPADEVVHAEMRLGEARIGIGTVWSERIATPKQIGKATGSIHVQLKDGIDAHCARARAAGAEIIRELAT